ncbi:MAG: hypothetical protein H0U90_01625 [Actinobacteria bacterium]|nr:hypothetical protein [Actinomycetota bacterium]
MNEREPQADEETLDLDAEEFRRELDEEGPPAGAGDLGSAGHKADDLAELDESQA